MLLPKYGVLLAVAMTGLFCLTPSRMFGQAAQPQYKNQQEFQLYDAILKDTNPKTKLEKIQDWEKQFPSTEFMKERHQLYFNTYVALNMPKETAAAAKAVLADNPKDFNALYYTMVLTRILYTGTETAVLDDGDKAAQALLADIANAPAGVAADQWAKLRPAVEEATHTVQGFVAIQRKNWDGAEAEFKKGLEVNQNSSDIDYLMYVTEASKKNNSAALFYLARAAGYDGPGSLPAATRQGHQATLKTVYTAYHGAADGLDELTAAAKAAPNPPKDFHIKSKSEILKEKYAADAAGAEKFAKEHPDLALWKSIKETLASPTGADYFNSNMKDAKVLTLRGKIVKMEPALKPKTLYLAMDDGATADFATPDATLKFETPLPGKMEPGTELTFEGVGVSYTASPLMVVFNILDKADLHGWTAKNAPAAPARPARRPGAKK